eukprot:scaffold31531_cov35-Attheya_sp.AAC.1
MPTWECSLGHTGDAIDMRFGIEPSPVGQQLSDHLSSDDPKYVILLAKSGDGKTTLFAGSKLTYSRTIERGEIMAPPVLESEDM